MDQYLKSKLPLLSYGSRCVTVCSRVSKAPVVRWCDRFLQGSEGSSCTIVDHMPVNKLQVVLSDVSRPNSLCSLPRLIKSSRSSSPFKSRRRVAKTTQLPCSSSRAGAGLTLLNRLQDLKLEIDHKHAHSFRRSAPLWDGVRSGGSRALLPFSTRPVRNSTVRRAWWGGEQ